MEPKRYAVTLRNPAAHKHTLTIAHGVMAAAEHIGCAHRVMKRYFKGTKGGRKGRPGDRVVIWHEYFSAAGAIGELRARLMRYKPCEVAAREYLAKVKPKLVPVLDRVVSRQIRGDLPMQMCCFAQVHYFAHWNENVSSQFVESMAFDGTDPPVLVTSEDGGRGATGSPWMKEAWRRGWKREFNITEAKLRVMMTQINQLCTDAAKMGRHAAMGILLSTGAELVPPRVSGEDESAPDIVVTPSGKRIRISA